MSMKKMALEAYPKWRHYGQDMTLAKNIVKNTSFVRIFWNCSNSTMRDGNHFSQHSGVSPPAYGSIEEAYERYLQNMYLEGCHIEIPLAWVIAIGPQFVQFDQNMTLAHMMNCDVLSDVHQSAEALHDPHEYEEDGSGSLSEMEALWTCIAWHTISHIIPCNHK